MAIHSIQKFVAGVIIALAMSGCAAFIEPQERALINILTQIDLNHQAIMHANYAPADCMSGTVEGRFTTACR